MIFSCFTVYVLANNIRIVLYDKNIVQPVKNLESSLIDGTSEKLDKETKQEYHKVHTH